VKATRALDERASQQLSALGRLNERFEDAGIAYWLFGGWAVDFYVGAVTREHDDIDLAVWVDDLARIAELLRADGWRHAPDEDEDGGTGYALGGVRLELTYLVRGDDGSIVTPLRDGNALWPREAFAGDRGELEGTRARLLALAPLAAGKSFPRADPADAAKDREDFRRLSRLGPAVLK
jgi:Uncharacterised nucleotidyltransferase